MNCFNDDNACEDMYNFICGRAGLNVPYMAIYYVKTLLGVKKIGTELMRSRDMQTNLESAERLKEVYARENSISIDKVKVTSEAKWELGEI